MKEIKIDIYTDGANINDMLNALKNPIIKGFTTNPSLMKKAGVKSYREFSKEVLKNITSLPVSFEVFADDLENMKKEALEIKSWGSNVFVKIPTQLTNGAKTYDLVQDLVYNHKIQVNVTAITSVSDVKEWGKILNNAPFDNIVSVFFGRLADSGIDYISHLKEMRPLLSNKAKLLWASTREVYNIIEAQEHGCDIITASPEVISKISGFGKTETDITDDTVKTFAKDIKELGFSILKD